MASLERDPQNAEKYIAFQSSPGTEFVDVFQLETDGRLTDFRAVGKDRANAEHTRLQALGAYLIPETIGARAAVFAELLVEIAGGAECQTAREMLQNRCLEMELRRGFVVGRLVLEAEGRTNRSRHFQAALFAQISQTDARIECPAVFAKVEGIVDGPVWHIDDRRVVLANWHGRR